MALPIISRLRSRPIQLEKDVLIAKAIEVAQKPDSLAELPSGAREQVDTVVKALSAASMMGTKPRRVGQPVQSPRAVSGAVLAVRAHQILGPSSNITPPEIAVALATSGMDWVEPFAPGTPLTPFYGYSRRPRGFDYRIGRNVTTETREDRIPFHTIEQLFDSYDVARILTNHAINAQRAMRVRFMPMEGFEKYPTKEIQEAMRRLRRPDGFYHLKQWVAIHQKNLFKFDSAPVYRQRDKAGNVKRYINISAKTIAPMLNYYGEIGDFDNPDTPAYEQTIQGVPWDWLKRSDIIYEPFWPDVDSPYGTPPLETVLINANTDVRLQLFFLQFFTAGAVPEAFALAPEGMSHGDDLADFQEQFDDYFWNDQADRWGLKWLPAGTEIIQYKPQQFDPDFAEYVMRRTASAFMMNAHDIGFTQDVNRSSGATQLDITESISEIPIKGYYEELFDSILQEDWGLPVQLRFVPPGTEEDTLDKAQAHYYYWQMGAERNTDVRRELGYLVDPEQEGPLGIMDQRLGWMPWARAIATAGDVDPRTGMPKAGSVEQIPYELPGSSEPPQGQPNKDQGGKSTPAGRRPKGDPTKAYPEPLPLHSNGASKEALQDGQVAERRPPQPLSSGSPQAERGDADGYGGWGELSQGSGAQGTGVIVDPDAEREDVKRWREKARKAVARGQRPPMFYDSAIAPGTVQKVWAHLEHATTRGEVDRACKDGLDRKAAGICVQAKDSGRVLLIQRTPDHADDDNAYARWEWPGGKLDGGHNDDADEDQTVWAGALREWEEETGAELPDAYEVRGSWVSDDGDYEGFVVGIDSEADLDLDPDPEETADVRWWDPADLDDPKVRDKVQEQADDTRELLKFSDTSGMVSLDLSDALPVALGEGVGFQHITVVYVGDIDDIRYGELCEAVRAVAVATPGPLIGTAGGRGTFPPSESSDWKTPVFAIPNVPGIEGLRVPLERFNASQHTDFYPHVTIAYIDKGDPLPEPVPQTPIRFTHLSVWRGGQRRTFPFGGCEDELAKANPNQRRRQSGQWRSAEPMWEDFHKNADRIVEHYTPLIEEALSGVLAPEVVDQVLTVAYGELKKAQQQPPASGAFPAQAAAVAAGTAGLASGAAAVAAGVVAGGGAAAGALAAVTAAQIASALAMLAIAPRILAALRNVLTRLYADAASEGSREAAEATGGETLPGLGTLGEFAPRPAVEPAVEKALSELLRDRDIWIKGMSDTEVDRVGQAIRQSVENGRPLSEARAAIDAIVHDGARAKLIAETEYARASTVARRATYLKNAIEYVGWLHQPGACPRCLENAAVSPIPITAPWPSGDVPVHPRCRCVEVPVVRKPS